MKFGINSRRDTQKYGNSSKILSTRKESSKARRTLCLYIIGGHDMFGNWAESGLGVQMKWTEGHIWTKEMKSKQLPIKFEFKFIVKQADGTITWESRDNRVFDASKIKYTLSTSHRLKSKGQTALDKGSTKLEYNGEDGIAKLTFEWGK